MTAGRIKRGGEEKIRDAAFLSAVDRSSYWFIRALTAGSSHACHTVPRLRRTRKHVEWPPFKNKVAVRGDDAVTWCLVCSQSKMEVRVSTARTSLSGHLNGLRDVKSLKTFCAKRKTKNSKIKRLVDDAVLFFKKKVHFKFFLHKISKHAFVAAWGRKISRIVNTETFSNNNGDKHNDKFKRWCHSSVPTSCKPTTWMQIQRKRWRRLCRVTWHRHGHSHTRSHAQTHNQHVPLHRPLVPAADASPPSHSLLNAAPPHYTPHLPSPPRPPVDAV